MYKYKLGESELFANLTPVSSEILEGLAFSEFRKDLAHDISYYQRAYSLFWI